jgi:hypothetical protein
MPVVYILTNPAMPGLVKIGCTERTIQDRLRELTASAGVPLPFECFLAVEVDDPWPLESALHDAFGDNRLNPRREFFELSPDKPAAILKYIQNATGVRTKNVTPSQDVVETPEEQEALDSERRRRSGFRFSEVGISKNAVLTSAFDSGQTCEVYDDRKVLFRGEVTSLSKSALTLAHETGRNWSAIQGPQYWNYQGKSLEEMRQEKGEEELDT